MAYQAKRRKTYEEEFQLVDDNGNVVHSLMVSLDVDSVAVRLSEKHMALVHALDSMKSVENKTDDDKLTVLGNTVIDILEAVFGKEDTKIILDFYENKYLEMCQEVMPFVTNVVIPEVRKMAQANKKHVLSKYNRKQRRTFGNR